MDFQTFHRYRQLVRRGMAEPLRCRVCENEVVTRLGELDSVVLWCYTCDSITLPGINTCEKVRAIVAEFFLYDIAREL